MRLIRLLLMLIVAVAAPAGAADRAPLPESVAAYIDTAGDRGFSGTILVARRGEVLKRAFGFGNREWNDPNTADTIFKIGSLTKQFTATGLLILVDEGKIALDDRLCAYLDDCPSAWAAITIRQLLNHSSGIPDFVRLPGVRERFTQPMKLSDTIALLERQPLDFAPGSEARYGNSGFLIAAWLIERLSGIPYDRFIAERIYRPLGMTRSGYAFDAPILARRARGYVIHDGQFENAPYIDMSVPIGAGSQYSTIEDLYRWDRALASRKLLSPESYRAMFARGLGEYSLGWEVTTENGRRVIQHNGDINGFGAFIARYPDADAVIIILTNTEGTKVRDMKNAIAARLFGDGYFRVSPLGRRMAKRVLT
jgi:D-alanyl-D-alanine carboxypeptidase